ncbi:MAG: YbaB/EbfC family nucleoid-associated protein, partial [Hyphomicrobiaceae bacterium]|nr:YbaB/EbfC family nucleoid-associated protein [Hyphomicrobiaceae bacterium]
EEPPHRLDHPIGDLGASRSVEVRRRLITHGAEQGRELRPYRVDVERHAAKVATTKYQIAKYGVRSMGHYSWHMAQRPPNDMRKLMEQAQQMQSQLAAAQEELAAKTYEGTAGGGAVTVVVSGAGHLVSVDFESTALDPEDPEMAGDLVVAAANQAFAAAAEDATSSMGDLGMGMDLGGLLG